MEDDGIGSRWVDHRAGAEKKRGRISKITTESDQLCVFWAQSRHLKSVQHLVPSIERLLAPPCLAQALGLLLIRFWGFGMSWNKAISVVITSLKEITFQILSTTSTSMSSS